jgi:hypothetical protein
MKQATSILNRMAEVVQLRDAAVNLAKEKGDWKIFGPNITVGQFDNDILSVWYSLFPHCFGIDVWERDRKVLNVQWTDAGVDIVTFKRGDWENRLIDDSDNLAWEHEPLGETKDSSRQQAA